MPDIEEKKRRVLNALIIHSSKSPECKEDCEDCPYMGVEDGCIARLHHDAYYIIIHQDKLLQQMTDPNTVMIDKTAKPVQGARYCKENRTCYGVGQECPYRNQKGCFESMVTDLLNLIEGGDAP